MLARPTVVEAILSRPKKYWSGTLVLGIRGIVIVRVSPEILEMCLQSKKILKLEMR